MAICEYLMWRDPQVEAYGQYLLSDDPGRLDYLSFQTGLRYADGAPKPAYSSFPMTLMARRIASGDVVLWGHVRPGYGVRRVDLSYRDPAEQIPRPLSSVYTDNHGYFIVTAPDRAGREFRATSTLDDNRVLQGPFIHSYKFPLD
jgi:hypothetical protein